MSVLVTIFIGGGFRGGVRMVKVNILVPSSFPLDDTFGGRRSKLSP